MSEQTKDATNGAADGELGPDDWTDEPTGDGGSTGAGSTGGDRMAEEGETDHAAVVSGGGVVERDDAAESATSLD